MPVRELSSLKRRRSHRKSIKVLAYLGKKKARGDVYMAYPRVRNMFRVETPWLINNKLRSRKTGFVALGKARQWARESLSRRFIQGDTLVDPHQDPAGQAGLLIRGDTAGGNACDILGAERRKRTWFRLRYQALVGDAKVRKKFVRIMRGILSDLGVALVGPVPFRILEIMWEYFGEEHFSAHSRACWCRLCRSVGPSRLSFLQAIGDSLYNYFVSWKFAVNATFGLIAPAPLRMAKFVANKFWKWLKVVLEGQPAFDRLQRRAHEWVRGESKS
jgi:hypothetical protein